MTRKEQIGLLKSDFKKDTNSIYRGLSRYLAYKSSSDAVTLIQDTRSCFNVQGKTYVNSIDKTIHLCGSLSYSEDVSSLWLEFKEELNDTLFYYSHSFSSNSLGVVFISVVYTNGFTVKTPIFRYVSGRYLLYYETVKYLGDDYYDIDVGMIEYENYQFYSNNFLDVAVYSYSDPSSHYLEQFKNNPPTFDVNLKLDSFIDWVHLQESIDTTCCLHNCFNQ